MATKLLIAMHNSVLVIESSNTNWKSYESLKGNHMPQCIAFDPSNSNRAYCGTFGGGLWKTDDSGDSWNNIGNQSISSKDIMSVSVSNLERGDKEFNTVYVGTEPTTFYRSDDGGKSWEKMSSLNNLKSSTSWSFPPRPWTSHVSYIEPDKTKSGYLNVARGWSPSSKS